MLKCLGGMALLVLLCGCTADWDSSRKSSGLGSKDAPLPGKALPVGIVPLKLALAPRPRNHFASLPDRGELLAYDAVRKPRISGAYSAYPVQLSEEHAFNAARAGGKVVIVSPKGESISLSYERHTEHPDGNWTWVGRDASGADAVITFGEEAAFGTVPVPDEEALRLTIADGGSWLVSTDKSKIPDANRGIIRTGEEDYLIPPKAALRAASDNPSKVPSPLTQSAIAAAATGPTVDVVLGYTTGLAAALGGDSQAVTRLNNLVEIANQAYANSAIDATLRLVGTVSVNYTDSSDNGDTLEKLSGYKSGTGPITPDPAFAALRTARETYSADLVSLVRDFRTPQNNGCGIAWLIGSDQSPVETSDSPFGYSVVSDGSDLDEGDSQTYFCRDESLAHELGHNMGQAHNVEDSAGGSGVHAYSYGYRETSSNGFYTVMAYRITGSNQFSIRHFANPAVNSNGRPTGVANQSDNARSMMLTMPIIATFRSATVPPPTRRGRADMNGDGRSDVIWRNTATAQTSRWYMSGPTVIGGQADSQAAGYRIVGIGDFDADGRDDLLWADAGNSHLIMWRPAANGQYVGNYVGASPAGWTVAGVGDMNGDSRTDVIWRNTTTQQSARWYMDGPAVIGGQADSQAAGYRIVGIGDFDADGRDDLLWTDAGSNHLIMWRPGANGQYAGNYVGASPAGWTVAGVGDMNGDGRADIVWRNDAAQQTSRWYMNGPTVIGGQADSQASGYRIVGIGDFDADGRDDLLWTDAGTNHLIMWRPGANGQYVGNYVGAVPPGGWTVENATF